MANKPLKSIKFPGLPDTYTIPQVDSTPTQGSSNAVSSGGVYEEINEISGDLTKKTEMLSDADIISFIEDISEYVDNEFISTSGNVLANNYYRRTTPIAVKKGQRIKGTAYATTSVAIIAKFNSGETPEYQNVITGSAQSPQLLFDFISSFDGYIVFSYSKNYDHYCYVYDDNTANVKKINQYIGDVNSRIIDVENSVYTKSTNLANTTNTTSGKVITIDGDIVDNASYKISDYFLMEPGEYTFANINYLAVYDLSKTFIKRIGLSNGSNYAVTEYRYIRIVSNKSVETWQINKGTTLLAYEPFYTINRLEDLEKDTNIIQPFIAGSNIYNRSSNLADTNNVTDGKVINARGEIVDNTTYHISDYLLLEPGDYVGKQVVYLAIYDLNKNFIERKDFGNNIITLNDYRYVRIVTNRSASTWQINKGVTLLDYEPFYAFNRVNAVDNKINSSFHKADYSLFKTDFTGWYKGLNENYADSTTMGFDTKYADVISMMDDLMAMSPNYVTKNALGTGSGTDSSNNPYTIYEYVFTPPVYTPPVTLTPIMYAGKHPKILIDACCQGDEKNSTFGWYYFLYDLVNNYDKNPALQAIRYGVEIHFLPVMCPWGFDNNSYTTENGVNLNRNFQVPDWAEEEHSGAVPFSEIDAQVARDWIIANTDALLYINTHTNGMWYASGYASMNANFMATGMNDEYFDKIFKAIGREIEHQTAMILQEHGNVIQPDSPEQLLGRIVPQPVAGNTHGYINHYAALYHNMVSITLEAFNGLRDNNDNLVISTFAPISKKICSEIFGNHLIKHLEEYAKV